MGAWSVLKHLFPDVPVVQTSLGLKPHEHYSVGRWHQMAAVYEKMGEAPRLVIHINSSLTV